MGPINSCSILKRGFTAKGKVKQRVWIKAGMIQSEQAPDRNKTSLI